MSGQRKPDAQPEQSLFSRLTWFVLIWLGSIAALTVVAYGIRLMIKR